MECDRQVDPVWYYATMRRERQKQREEEYRKQREEQFRFKDLEEITEILTAEMGGVSSSDVSPETPEKSSSQVSTDLPSRKKRKLFVEGERDDNDVSPHMSHIRDSERKVRDQFYLTVSALSGRGLSLNECCHAVVEVGNGLFNRKWKFPNQDNDTFDMDTLPALVNIRSKLRLIEAETLSLVVSSVTEAKESGRAITASIDSTTKRGVGQFATQGLQIGQNCPVPLPLMAICGETTEDVAMQVDHAMEILAAVRGVSPKEIYQLIDVHMTDSVSHNKGIAKELATMYDLDTVAGQIFCGSHTTLGFSNGLNKKVSVIESDMKVDQILKNFMVGMDLDSKNGSLAGQALDMCLKLVAPEYSHKMWNYYQQFTNFLQQKEVKCTLFSYKDQRFGCLSRAAGVLLYNLPYLEQFLASNPHINNRLACLVRELLDLPYLKVVFCVFAAVGLHVIEPFYSKTIDKQSTHSSLKEFYTVLYNDLGKSANDKFFSLDAPVLDSVPGELFSGVLSSYGEDVVTAIKDAAEENLTDCVALLNLCLPELQTVLARQRRDYGLSQEYPAEFPVFDQCSNIDDTPVNNIAMERQCGTVDYRLKKLRTLESVSRSMILAKAVEMRDGKESQFRSFKMEVEKKRQLELNWQQKTKDKFAEGANERQLVAQAKERKRLDLLDNLKEMGGPFTSAEQVQMFLDQEYILEREKQKRMKKEVQFARMSSTTLPSNDPLFKIQVSLPTGKRRDKTAKEFGDSLMVFLGKKSDSNIMDYNIFRSSLRKYTAESDSNNN